MFQQERWNAAWESVGARPSKALLAELVARYSEPARFYHTLQHLRECFAGLESARHLAERPAEVDLAIWFHDAIYDTRAQDNEDKSARWAEAALVAAGASHSVAGRVRELISFTKHSAVPIGDDASVLVDIDLSILGAAEPRFAEYEQQVRQEYGWVPESAYRQGRARVLSSFLGRSCIYSTPLFKQRLELRARSNLERSVRELVV
jgi:predicted metal-dependent HD superfamily phosphohydrolase